MVKYLLQIWWMPAKWSSNECLMCSLREGNAEENPGSVTKCALSCLAAKWNQIIDQSVSSLISPSICLPISPVNPGKWLLHPAGRVQSGQSWFPHPPQLPYVQNVLLPLWRNAGMSSLIIIVQCIPSWQNNCRHKELDKQDLDINSFICLHFC